MATAATSMPRCSPTGLKFPNGVLAARGGVFVTAAPDLLFLKDADGDGRAEVQQRGVHRIRRGEPATSGQRADLGTRQLDLRRQRPQRRRSSAGLAIRRTKRSRFAAATFASAPTAAGSKPPAAPASSARPATTGAIDSCRGTRFRFVTPCSISDSSIATRAQPLRGVATSPTRPIRGTSFPSALVRRRSIASVPTITTRCAG